MSVRQDRKHRKQGGGSVKAVLSRVKQLGSFNELKPGEYAVPDGFADKVARNEKKMKTTQLRKFFSKIKNLERELKGRGNREVLDDGFKSRMYLLLPELAYSKGRQLINEDFFDLITIIVKDKLKTVGDFKNFANFMTAIVAYKKAHGD